MFDLALQGLLSLFDPSILVAMVLGVMVGMVVGAVPGLTSSIGIALFIPITYGMDPLVALVFFAGLDTSASYGGAIPAILLRIPGTPGAVCTAFDGAPMADRGDGASALRIACYASALGGMLSAVVLLLLSPPLARVTLAFGPPEMFWVNVLGLCAVAVLLGRDPLKGLIAAVLGLLLGTVGIDRVTGFERFTFGNLNLIEGLSTIVVLVGLFALPAVWSTLETMRAGADSDLFDKLRPRPFVWPHRRINLTVLKSAAIGTIFGILPGVGGTAAGFIAYNEARRSAPDPSQFGKGEPTGVAAPEAANSAANSGAMVPALTLGIPGSASAAVMLGALVVHGLQPGPGLFSDPAGTIWGYMWAMLAASVLVFLCGGTIATRVFGQVLRLPPSLLMPMIAAMALIGTYAVTGAMFHVWIMFACGLLGYAMMRLEIPIAPLVLGLILGENAESSLRTSLLLSRQDPAILFTRPLSIALVSIIALILLTPVVRAVLRRRNLFRGSNPS